MNIRKQVYELSLEDINEFPVWEFALDEEGEDDQDEATVRPVKSPEQLDPSAGMFIVKAQYTFADGTKAHGYLTPPVQGDSSLGTLQPVIVTAQGQVGFWCGVIAPTSEQIAKHYSLLSKDGPGTFPLRFASSVILTTGPVSGIIPGFVVLEDWRTGTTRVVS